MSFVEKKDTMQELDVCSGLVVTAITLTLQPTANQKKLQMWNVFGPNDPRRLKKLGSAEPEREWSLSSSEAPAWISTESSSSSKVV